VATIAKAYRLKLYPSPEQRQSFARHAGACRWLWNRLLALQIERHKADGTFVFFHDMSKMLPGLKTETPWLAEAPSNALVRVCKNLDRALRDAFPKNGSGKKFPTFKAKGKARDAFYVAPHVMKIEGNRVLLPKCGSVRFRCGRLPEGRILSGTVSRRAGEWFLTVQCQVEIDIPAVEAQAETVVGVDLGLTDLMICSDGVRVKPPKALRAALKRLKRAQKVLSRRKKGSANRAKQARLVATLHAKVADRRADAQHKATRALVNRASMVVTEDPAVRNMMRNPHLALSFADAGWGETLRQIGYKAEWAGKTHLKADRFSPSTQTCSACGERKTGSDKLRLHQRIYSCDACGHEADRDANAAENLRRLGLEALCADEGSIVIADVGRVTPQRAGDDPADARGDPSAGPVTPVAGRRGSQKREVLRATSDAT
jgi:putative transposase